MARIERGKSFGHKEVERIIKFDSPEDIDKALKRLQVLYKDFGMVGKKMVANKKTLNMRSGVGEQDLVVVCDTFTEMREIIDGIVRLYNSPDRSRTKERLNQIIGSSEEIDEYIENIICYGVIKAKNKGGLGVYNTYDSIIDASKMLIVKRVLDGYDKLTASK